MQGNENLEKFNQQKKPKKSRPDKVRQKKRGHFERNITKREQQND